MQQSEAQALARDITETWQLTASTRIWAQALAPMDHDIAGRTYIELRRSHVGRDMSIGQFSDEYKRRRPPPPVEPEPDCPTCQADGWLTREYVQHGHTYTGVEPCPDCKAGVANEPAYRRTLTKP